MPRRLVVAHVEHSTEHGGAELALRRLLACSEGLWTPRLLLSGRGSNLGVFADVPPGIETVRSGVDQRPGATTGGLGDSVRTLGSVFREARRWRRELREVDLVHANTSRSSLVAAMAMWGSSVPLVVHLRDRVDADSLGRFGHLAFRTVVARRATSYIANSESTADSVRAFARERTVEVIASPIGVTRASTTRPAQHGSLRIGMVARLDPWKGQHLVLEAFARSVAATAGHLHLFGDASFGKEDYARRLHAQVSRLGLHNVTFEGFVDDVQSAIDGLDICVQYSDRPEPMGQNVLQYLARGRATIVADEGGPAEWVTDRVNGLRVPPRDISALSDALNLLATDARLRDRLGAAAAATPGLPTDESAARAHQRAFAAAALA